MSWSSIYTMFSIVQCVHSPSFAPVPPENLFTLSDQDLKASLVLCPCAILLTLALS